MFETPHKYGLLLIYTGRSVLQTHCRLLVAVVAGCEPCTPYTLKNNISAYPMLWLAWNKNADHGQHFCMGSIFASIDTCTMFRGSKSLRNPKPRLEMLSQTLWRGGARGGGHLRTQHPSCSRAISDPSLLLTCSVWRHCHILGYPSRCTRQNHCSSCNITWWFVTCSEIRGIPFGHLSANPQLESRARTFSKETPLAPFTATKNMATARWSSHPPVAISTMGPGDAGL